MVYSERTAYTIKEFTVGRKIREIRVCGDLAYIQLTQGEISVIDRKNVDLVAGNNWSVARRKNTCYAFRSYRNNGKSTCMLLHRLIAGAPDGCEVDHIDGDGLNNRESNLRICSRKENLRNVGLRSSNRSGFKGVHKRSDRNKWQAQIRDSDGKNKHLGYFDTPEEAHEAYKIACDNFHRDYANYG